MRPKINTVELALAVRITGSHDSRMSCRHKRESGGGVRCVGVAPPTVRFLCRVAVPSITLPRGAEIRAFAAKGELVAVRTTLLFVPFVASEEARNEFDNRGVVRWVDGITVLRTF